MNCSFSRSWLLVLLMLATVGWLPLATAQPTPINAGTSLGTNRVPGGFTVIEQWVPTNAAASTGRDEAKPARIQRNQLVMLGQDVVLKTNEVSREVVCFFGNATIQGEVEQDVFVLGGHATVEGSLGRDLKVLFGSATLAPTARINGRTLVVGGGLQADPAAVIGRERREFRITNRVPGLAGLKDWLRQGLLFARPLPPRLSWVWIIVAVCFLINVVLAVMFPRTLQTGVETLEKRPVRSFFVGLLVFVLFGPLVLLLVVSGFGVLVLPFLICTLVAMTMFGKLVAYRFTGLQFGRHFGLPALQRPLAALAIGTGVFYLLYMVPVLGFVVWGGVTLLGVGTVAMTATAKLGNEAEPRPVAATAVAGQTASIPATEASPEIVLAENASLARVGFWRRFIAMLLDFILICILSAIIHVPPLALFLWLGYHLAMWSWKGTTIGGIIMGIKIVREDGRPMSFPVTLVRSLASCFSAIMLGLGFFWAGWSRSRQAWHDKIAGTIVVRVPRNLALV